MGNRTIFSTNNAGKNGYPHEKRKHIIYKNIRPKTIKIPVRKHRRKLHDMDSGNNFFYMTKCTGKNRHVRLCRKNLLKSP